jgi:hypothetical protein
MIHEQYLGISGLVQGEIGTPYTYIGLGLNLQVGQIEDYFLDLGFQRKNGVKFYFFSILSTKYVAYNATIQGGLIEPYRGPYEPEIIPFLYELNSGINVSFSTVNMELGIKQVSPEIRNSSSHRWGYVTFTFAL